VLARGGADLDRAEAALAEAQAVIERTSTDVCRPWLTEWQAEVTAARGDTEAARALFLAAAEAHMAQGAPGHALRLKGRTA
jgi:hypothetical protein